MLRVVAVALAGCLVTLAVALPAATRGAPARCSDASASRLVERFAVSVSAGRLDATDALWARGSAFAWYSTSAPGARTGDPAADRSTLRAYFRSRIAAGEKLRVLSMKTIADPRRGLRHFHGTVSRRAHGMRATRYAFKGAADCRTRRLSVWSMSPKRSQGRRRREAMRLQSRTWPFITKSKGQPPGRCVVRDHDPYLLHAAAGAHEGDPGEAGSASRPMSSTLP